MPAEITETKEIGACEVLRAQELTHTHTTSFTNNTFTRNSFTHLPSTCISCTHQSSTISSLFRAFPIPSSPFFCILLLLIGRSWHVGLSGPLTTHRSFNAQKLWHRGAFTHRRVYTQKLLCTEALTHRGFYTEKSLHRRAFTHRSYYKQKLLLRVAVWSCKFAIWPEFVSRERVAPEMQKRNLASAFGTRPSCRVKGLRLTLEIAILHQFFTFGLHFVLNCCVWSSTIGIPRQCLTPAFVKGRRHAHKIRISPHVYASVRSTQRVTFRNPPPGCPCRLKREVQKSLRNRSFVGVQLQLDHLEVNSCVTTSV